MAEPPVPLLVIVCADCQEPVGRVEITGQGPMLTGQRDCPVHGSPVVSEGTLSAYVAAALVGGQIRTLPVPCR